MAKTFKVSIVTAEQTLLETEATSLTLPGIAGYLGVLANHAPLVTALVPGTMTMKTPDGGPDSVFFVSNGFVEVARNEVSVMVDACEPAPDIDVTRAELALERAKERLGHRDEKVDVVRADAAMARAKARLMASKKKH